MGVTLTQAMKELQKLQELHERRPGGKRELSEVEVARTICFVINKAAWGQATPAQTRQAQQLHFALYGTPEIDLSKFGPRAVRRLVCLDGGKPNQLAEPWW